MGDNGYYSCDGFYPIFFFRNVKFNVPKSYNFTFCPLCVCVCVHVCKLLCQSEERVWTGPVWGRMLKRILWPKTQGNTNTVTYVKWGRARNIDRETQGTKTLAIRKVEGNKMLKMFSEKRTWVFMKIIQLLHYDVHWLSVVTVDAWKIRDFPSKLM
jgi:hypothetical protein